jgi:hypothetical protein
LLARYGASDVTDFNRMAAVQMDSLQRKTYRFAYVMAASMAFILLVWPTAFARTELLRPLFVTSTAVALVVLVTSLMSPMIEIDARIQKLDFVLLGKNLRFHDQVLFFQSKSIIDVVRILLATRKPDSLFVGLLILIFSVVFPVVKLIAANLRLVENDTISRNKVIAFFAFKSGKWSMADVTVVAIFMAYIGFKGILDNQLAVLNAKIASLDPITTNFTSLQPGFILFLGFVLFGLSLSEILHKIVLLKGERLYD